MKSIASTAMICGLLAFANAAGAHNHVTVDTASGSAGDQILIRAGYYGAEVGYAFSNRRLTFQNQVVVRNVGDVFPDGPYAGFYGGDELLLTSDFYFSTGRLDGGNFQWELFNVRETRTNASGTILWGEFHTSGFEAVAKNGAATRFDRSFDTGAGMHNHHQGYAFQDKGVYDVTFAVWDSNGRYGDADHVRVRFNVGPVCTCDYDLSGAVEVSDIFAFLNRWFAEFGTCIDACTADFNIDDVTDVSDIFAFLSAWFSQFGVCQG